MDGWRQIKESDRAFSWLRMHSPPAIRLGTSLLAVFDGGETSIQHLAFSSDGRRIIGAGRCFDRSVDLDSSALLWDVGKRSLLVRRPCNAVCGVQFVGSSACVIVSDDSESTVERLVDVENGQIVSGALPSRSRVIQVGNSRETHDCQLPLRAADEFACGANGELLFRGRSLGETVTCAAFSPEGTSLITGNAEGLVCIWSVATGECMHQFCAHEIGISCLAISPDGECLATGGDDSVIRLWDPTRREATYRSQGFGAAAGKVAHSPDGRFTVTASRGKLRLWDTQTGSLISTLDEYEYKVRKSLGVDVAYAAHGQLIAFVAGRHVKVYDARSAQQLWAHDTEFAVGLMDTSPDGEHIITTGDEWDGLGSPAPYVFGARSGAIVRRLGSGTDYPNFKIMKVSPKGNYVVAVGRCRGLFLWELGTGRELISDYDPLESGCDDVRCVAWSPNEENLAVGLRDRVRIVCMRTFLMGLDAEGNWSNAAFNEEFRHSGSYEKDHDLDTADVAVRQIAYLPDGRHLVAELADDTMRIWFHGTHRMIAQMRGTCECSSAMPRPQGLPFLALSRGNETVIEDVATKKPIAWFPLGFQDLRSYPSLRTWRGMKFDRLHIFSLEPPSYQIAHVAMPATTSSKRILLIDRIHWDDGGAKDSRHVRDNLANEYAVETYEYLDERVPELIRMALGVAPYDAVVTHLPPDESYSKGFGLMKEVKQIAAIPIIAYTGAGTHVLAKFDAGHTDGVVLKTHDVRADLAKLQTLLRDLLSDENRRLRSEPTPSPRITVNDGFTTVQALVRLNPRVLTRNAMQIAGRCSPFPGEVTCQVLDPPSDNAPTLSLKSIVDLIGAALKPRTRIAIRIEGDNAAAQTLAREMYSAFTSRWSFDMKFDQF